MGSQRSVAVASISPNPRQPRHKPEETGIEKLAASIRRHGVLQPVVVSEEPNQPGRYYLVAGERRWRAARMAGLEEVPATIVTTDDRGQLELALVENLQRTDLGPLDRARAYRVLIEDFVQSQDEVAKALGVSRSNVANTLRLLTLDETSMAALEARRITEGHARALLAVSDSETRARLLAAIESEGLSVREAERWEPALGALSRKQHVDDGSKAWRQEVVAVLEHVQRRLGTKARIRGGEERGRIELEYYSSEELAHLVERLSEA